MKPTSPRRLTPADFQELSELLAEIDCIDEALAAAGPDDGPPHAMIGVGETMLEVEFARVEPVLRRRREELLARLPEYGLELVEEAADAGAALTH